MLLLLIYTVSAVKLAGTYANNINASPKTTPQVSPTTPHLAFNFSSSAIPVTADIDSNNGQVDNRDYSHEESEERAPTLAELLEGVIKESEQSLHGAVWRAYKELPEKEFKDLFIACKSEVFDAVAELQDSPEVHFFNGEDLLEAQSLTPEQHVKFAKYSMYKAVEGFRAEHGISQKDLMQMYHDISQKDVMQMHDDISMSPDYR
ncbi:hypothetical protein Plhal304r1_c012g0047781 [Plasmopara halstedii]